MNELCTDGRFEVIARAKEDLLRCTNIDTSPSEMAVLDEILFRCWQMGWLDKYEDKETDNHCEDCQDIVIADEAYAEYKANPKTYTLGEIIEMNDPCEDCQEFNCDYCPNRRARMEQTSCGGGIGRRG